MSNLLRLRYNTMADQTPGGEWKWRVIIETDGGFEEVLVKELVLNVPSFSQTDDMPVVGDGVLSEDGHCSYSPDRKWVLNDTYPDKDGRLQTLMLYHPATGRRYDLNRFHSPAAFAGPTRCDLHPRWDRDGTQVCFDGSHGPQRQVYVVDVREVIGRGA